MNPSRVTFRVMGVTRVRGKNPSLRPRLSCNATASARSVLLPLGRTAQLVAASPEVTDRRQRRRLPLAALCLLPLQSSHQPSRQRLSAAFICAMTFLKERAFRLLERMVENLRVQLSRSGRLLLYVARGRLANPPLS